jgi:hypothetical protein
MLNIIACCIRAVRKNLLVNIQIIVGMCVRVFALRIRDIIENLPGQLNIIVGKLSNLSIVDTQDLSFLSSTERETWNQVHDEQDDAGTEEGVCTTRDGVRKLVTKLDPVVVEPASRDVGETIQMGYVVGGEEGSEDVANETSNSVLSKDIKSIINTENKLELGGVLS